MKVVLGVGKAVALLFWLLVLVNLFQPFAQPFAWMLYLFGASVLLLHGLELMLFSARLAGHPNLPLQRLWVMLFGILHLLSLPEAAPAEAVEQPVVAEEVSHA
ncbi:DUF1145 domain-containing protein [Pseudomonas sp. UL073]|uniref:DUF1145 domain-containing protein n=1 Tax=Zestomonas insulae TaxID=2809017 RepID=A0ABS2IF52_9GAMM|nr:DUF1145 domain-containing protein [Pseudomonas insulae]MBM7060500.1 DUF1145 domain-containing protein [Pseudomonas insulae]